MRRGALIKTSRSNECEVMKVPARHLAKSCRLLERGLPPSRCNDGEFFGAVRELPEHVLAPALRPKGVGGQPSATFSPPQFRIYRHRNQAYGRDDEDRRWHLRRRGMAHRGLEMIIA
jgi:hypothetical protein